MVKKSILLLILALSACAGLRAATPGDTNANVPAGNTRPLIQDPQGQFGPP